jgi:hypothetical protein
MEENAELLFTNSSVAFLCVTLCLLWFKVLNSLPQ